MPKVIDSQRMSKVLGRHTRLAVPFRWTVAGTPVDLEADGYTVRVWVTNPDSSNTAGPFAATVAGETATYLLSVDDLAVASGSVGTKENVRIVAVAENGGNTLVSDYREILVGDWQGADDYVPTP